MKKAKKLVLSFWVGVLKSGRKFYKISDLMKVSGLGYAACRMAAGRLASKGMLIRLGKELYGNLLVNFTPEEAACQAYLPAYLSCEYVLSRYGVIDQMPIVLTAITLLRGKMAKVGSIEVDYRHLRKNLFWGYVRDGDAFIAEPEKAILDWLYLVRKRLGTVSLDEINWDELDLVKLKKYSIKFPKSIQRHINLMISNGDVRIIE